MLKFITMTKTINNTNKFFFKVAGFCCFLSVAMGALGAHFFSKTISLKSLEILDTATQYMFWHSIAILLTLLLFQTKLCKKITPVYFFLIGILLFSGSLYLYIFTNQSWLMFITPIGGLHFLSGWLIFTFYLLKK